VGVDTAITGIIVKNGNPFNPTIEAGICISWNPLPTIADRRIPRTSNNDSTRIAIRNLKPYQAYYIRPYVITGSGAVYGPQRTFATDSARLRTNMYGGVLLYVFKPGDLGYVENEFHGIVYHDFYRMMKWSNGSLDTLVGGLDSVMGSGASNTAKIVAALGSGDYAAKAVADLVIGPYDDWYLPPIDELALIRRRICSSTEVSKTEYLSYISTQQPRAKRLKSQTQSVYAFRRF
jgi:hypothetical protein